MKTKSVVLIVISSIVAIALILGMWSIGVNNSVKRMENDLDFRYGEIKLQKDAGDVRVSGFIQALEKNEEIVEGAISDIAAILSGSGEIVYNFSQGELLFYAGEIIPGGLADATVRLKESTLELIANFPLAYNTEINALQRLVTSYNSAIRDYKNKFVTFPNSLFLGGKSADPKFQLEGFPILIAIDHSNLLGN